MLAICWPSRNKLLGTNHSFSCFLRCVIKQYSACFNMKTMKITSSLLNNLLWALILGCSLCLKFPANSSIFTSLFVNEHKPTSMSVYCVPLLAEESVFQRLSIKSQCQYKEHMFSPERKCFLFAFPFGIYNEEQHVLRWVFPVGISSQSFLPALPLPATFSPAALWKAFLSDWKTVFFFENGLYEGELKMKALYLPYV